MRQLWHLRSSLRNVGKKKSNKIFGFSSHAFMPFIFVPGGPMNTIDLYEKPSDPNTDLIKCTASLVAAYVSRNAVGVGDLPVLIDQVHTAISVLQGGASGAGASWTGPTASQIEESIQHDGLISFIDGRSYKTLKRHLTAHGLTPERYRTRYGLSADYPLAAPGYAAKRSQIAKAIRLGHKAA